MLALAPVRLKRRIIEDVSKHAAGMFRYTALIPDELNSHDIDVAKMLDLCHGAITTHHLPAPDRVTNHELATSLGYGLGTGRNGRPAPQGNTGGASPDVARDEERVGVGGKASGGGSPDAATVKDWNDHREPHGARVPGEPHGARVPMSHMELGCRGKTRETARSSGVGKACGNESPEGRRFA